MEATSAFIREGIVLVQPTLVMVGPRKIELLRAALEEQAGAVSFADVEQVGANPARIIPAWREFADAHPGRRLRGIGEPVWAGRSPAELVECQRHEALLNLAFAEAGGFVLLCPYDTSALPEDVIAEARRSHPCLVQSGREERSPDYPGADELAAPFDVPLPAPVSAPAELRFGRSDLPLVRDFVAAHATWLDGAAESLVIAANEAASNTIRHGGGEGVVRMWDEDGSLVCEVSDSGRIEQPLVGREKPQPLQIGGHGVWLMNHLCDLVQIRAYADGGTVRLHVRPEAD